MSVVDIFDFDIRHLNFDKINPVYQAKIDKEGKGLSSQYSIFAKYDGKPLNLCLTIDQLMGGQTSNMTSDKKEFCGINDPQIKFSIGLNPKDATCVKLKDVINQIEKKLSENLEYLLSDELKSKGKKFVNYILMSDIKPVKAPSEEDPDIKIIVEDTEEKYSKLVLKYNENVSAKEILTVFESDDMDEDGEYVKFNSKTRADIAKIPLFKKKVRLMFKLVRVWVSKNPSSMCGNKKGYGITFKLQRVHIFDTMKKEEEIDDSAWFKEFKKPEKKDKAPIEEKENEEEQDKQEQDKQEEKQDIQEEKKEEEPEIQEEYVDVIQFAENENKPNEKKEDKKKKKTKKDHKDL